MQKLWTSITVFVRLNSQGGGGKLRGINFISRYTSFSAQGAYYTWTVSVKSHFLVAVCGLGNFICVKAVYTHT